jgi:transposase
MLPLSGKDLHQRTANKQVTHMGAQPKIALRPLSQAEQQALQRVAKASSERVDTVRRAKALLAVAAGESFTQAGKLAGLSREGVSQLVERFNQHGLAVLAITPGRGRKPTYGAQERTRVLQEARRQPDRVSDQTATWSLKLLQRALRRAGLPAIGSTTIGRILHEEGYSQQRDRTWCETGTAYRVRKDGIYRVRDPQAQKKKFDRAGLSHSRGLRAASVVPGRSWAVCYQTPTGRELAA